MIEGVVVETVTLGSDCTVRSIRVAHEVLRDARPTGSVLRADCGSVEQADVTLVQLVVSAAATLARRGIRLSVEPAAVCVQAAFLRAGVVLPDAARSSTT